ncbi:MAG: hypothetical protein AAF909_01370 [Pseudomonadota bacterium]
MSSKEHNQRDEDVARARAKLDQLREEAGMPLRGDELAARRAAPDSGARTGAEDDDPRADPPLDWRMTPRNVVLQLAAIALFIGVAWFLISLAGDGIRALLS